MSNFVNILKLIFLFSCCLSAHFSVAAMCVENISSLVTMGCVVLTWVGGACDIVNVYVCLV